MSAFYETAQEEFWAGDFGTDYIQRNDGSDLIASNTALFGRILSSTRDVRSVVELGCNIGLNLHALAALLPAARLTGVDVNERAIEVLSRWGRCEAHVGSLLSYRQEEPAELVLVKGVLIHVGSDRLPAAYDTLHALSRRYICLVEYYSPTVVEMSYRGHDDRLSKRDFAGEVLDRFPDLRLVDYGFVYHRDPTFPQDDVTWFLLEKSGGQQVS